MLIICLDFAIKYDVKFNHMNSCLFQFGLSPDVGLMPPKLNLGLQALNWVNELKYFGANFILSKKFGGYIDGNYRKF